MKALLCKHAMFESEMSGNTSKTRDTLVAGAIMYS